ncbi:MAG: DUF5946 family protein [Anaerolineaceae bacterium]|nr:DUF5946 family protein [Anaerolineaceae bacterium]
MPATPARCPECGAAWKEDLDCTACFHQMLAWETEHPNLGRVHHLMVLSYHLQHPSLYSPEGLAYARRLLDDFVAGGASPPDVRRRNRQAVDSGRRDFKITSRQGRAGGYPVPVAWTMTVVDVVAGGPQGYLANVEAWARAIHADLRGAG